MFPRIHPFMWDWSLRDNVYSRHEPFKLSSSVSSILVTYCLISTGLARPVLEQIWTIGYDLEDLRIFVHLHATCFLELSHRMKNLSGLSTILMASPWLPNCCELQISVCFRNFLKYNPDKFFTHVRYCSVGSVDTELIGENKRAKNCFDGFVIAVEMN